MATKANAKRVATSKVQCTIANPGVGAGQNKVRTSLEAAFAKGLSLPIRPDAMTSTTYPAVCMAFGVLNLRDAGFPLYVPATDSWVNVPKSLKLPAHSETSAFVRPEYVAKMAAGDPNSLRTAI